MKVIILGAGILGIQIARELVAENRDVVLIERNPDIAKGIANELDCMVQGGDGENLEILSDAGTADADWFIALTGSDEANIVACGLVAEAYNRPKTIARVRNEYFGSFHNNKRRILGVDYILNPEAEAADAVARIIFRGMSPETIDVKEAGIQLRKISASEDERFPGNTLQEIRAKVGRDFMIPAVVRGGVLITPTGQFVIQQSDLVYLLGEPRELDHLFGQTSRPSLRLKRLAFFGGSTLCRVVLKALGVPGPESAASRKGQAAIASGTSLSLLGNPVIRVIDENYENAKAISREFPDVEVVCRRLSDEFLIEEEGIDRSDIVFCLTSSQSDNLVTALVAKQSGVKRVLAVVFNDLYMRLEGVVGIDALVNQKSVVAGAILDILRKAHIRRLHGFTEGDFELIELSIGTEFSHAGDCIKNLGLPKGNLVAFVIHEGATIIPTGDTRIQAKDIVGLVIPKEQISKIESLFGD
ncbi:MAG: FAD-dependent oxidoreductase [Candidatus Shapirobacteria bacterium]|jgi:trk system potassium uptake protein TrkA